MISRVLFTIGFWLMIDIYFYQGFKAAFMDTAPTTRRALSWMFWAFDITLMAIFVYFVFTDKIKPGGSSGITFYVGLVFLSLLPKLIATPTLLLEDIFRIAEYAFGGAKKLFSNTSTTLDAVPYPSRRKFIGQIAVGLAALPFAGILYGITRGKYDYRVVMRDIWFKDLPTAFEGFTITQLSDVHSGSFDNKAEVARGVALANAQKSDMIVFTGDLVNSKATEMDPYIDLFSQLKAPYGQYSILGNHDYGTYAQWPSEEAQKSNFAQFLGVHKQIGFRLLRNESLKIEKDGQFIDLVGVENWGSKRFAKYGDLDLALKQTTPDSFKILLSHDPSHWEAVTLPHAQKVHLTMSGHTHGMQFGVNIPGFKWSPVQYVYKQWMGLYTQDDQNIYVNRGFGFLGFPGRVGMSPEITVLRLRRIS
jgi:uncharacterized protein